MTLHLYDTAARAVREFVPLLEGRVGIYLCGATVQAPPHIGHIRSGIAFDVLRRWLEANGQQVTFIRNVTDIDDKILHNAGHEEIPFWALAARNELAFTWAYDVLGCLRPTYEPRATGHVPEMIVLMQRLIDAGHAYAAGGDVYFDVRSFADYGALSGQRIDDMLPAADSDASVKRDPHDFALWKGAKPDEPHWDTPWGKGRPGWHLECSAMAGRYLGAEFDIHGGGMDLLFPHHENEVAQSRAAGDGFARYWLHNAWVTTSGEKMSKSLGNSLLVSEVVRRVRPIELRYYLAGAHYRSHLEYSEESLQQAAAGFRRLEGFLQRATQRCGPLPTGTWCAEFTTALDDDLGVPAALAAVHEVATEGNRALDAADLATAAGAAASVRAMLAVLGLDPFAEPWRSETGAGESDRLRAALDAVIADALAERAAARAAKDFARADAIRDRLAASGVSVEDGPDGARWTLPED